MVEKRQIYFFRETVVLQLIKNFPKTSWTSVQTKFVDGSMYNFRMLTYPKTFFALDGICERAHPYQHFCVQSSSVLIHSYQDFG